ncbi:MAG: alanine racemase, partial [Alphaproteobacteria bacterium]|nr:alanine racemase [Alphaproteobacteria bacterium]
MSIYTTPVLNINLKKLIENYKQLMTMSTPSIPAAVVKDDAYGIGAKMVAQTLYKKAHCRHFFVAHAKEGADIRPYIPDATIYVLQGIGADTLAFFEKYNLIPVISSPEMLKFWQQYQIEGIKPAIQIETGLNRLGFRKEELEELFNPNNQTLNTHLNCHPTELLSQSSSDTTSPSQASSEEDTFSLQSSSDTTSPSWSSSRRDVSHSTSGIHKPV